MFDHLLESRSSEPVRAGWISTAAVLHGAVLVVVVGASLLARIEAGADPPPPLPQLERIVVARLGDDPLAGGTPHRDPKPPERPPEVPREPRQPTPPSPTTPESFPTAPIPTTPSDAAPPSSGSEEPIPGDGSGGDGSGDRPGIVGVPWGRPEGRDVNGPPGPPVPRLPDEGDETEGYGVEPPTLIVRIEPEYPEVERRARIEGTVILDALVGSDGRVEIVKVMASPSPGLAAAAVRALQRWRYRPARRNGRAIGFHVRVQVHFTLR